jgi:S-DNA-T family DNA segregation ATPase FtsK/SpoIIIE
MTVHASRDAPSRRREVLALLFFALAALSVLALATFDDRDISPGASEAHNLIGPMGANLAHGLYAALGYAGYYLAAMLAVLGVAALVHRPVFTVARAVGMALLLPTLTLLLHLACAADPRDVAGGALGALLGEGLRSLVHGTGAWIVALSLLLFALLLATSFSLLTLGRLLRRAYDAAAREARVHLERWKRRRARRGKKPAGASAQTDADEEAAQALEAKVDRAIRRKERQAPLADAALPPEPQPFEPIPVPLAPPALQEPEKTGGDKAEAPSAGGPPKEAPSQALSLPREGVAAEASPAEAPKIVEPRKREEPVETVQSLQRQLAFAAAEKSWTLPPTGLLDYDPQSRVSFDREELMRAAERLTRALSDFKVEGRVVEIHPGPVITMFEFEPAAGTKVRQIQTLEDDLALALQALKVRIAPIPGKGVLGIEVANRERETVYLKEIIASEKFRKMTTRLPLALGKDISGQAVVTDLTKMPHLLVAGTTGSGKSVGLNSMLVSLLYQSSPAEVRIILVDQKMTEFGPYEGVPHLLLPVVVDPKRAAVALRWAVEEMERRYALMSELGVRHIGNYNKKVDQLRARGETLFGPTDADRDGEEERPRLERLPFVLLMIDELADLMMVAPREVESSLQRLAQMARAAGIHIIVATQRPSVDVISGVIRANFPARIAYQTRTRTDSRTILDDGGAEQLLGQGDMLLLPPGTSNLSRVHGAFVSDAEVKRVADFWREQGKPDYDPSILQIRDEEGAPLDDDYQDEMYDQAVAVVAETRQVSVSMLQRRLRVGYNRAARMVERMEREGIVGPADGTKPREVYVQPLDLGAGR